MKKQFDIKKLVLLNLPYLLMGLFATNFGEAWRLAQGANASEKFLSLFAVLPGALQSFWPSLHPLDLLVGLCCGAGLRLAVYLKSKNAKKYRHGMEYGSARWGTREDIAPYIDPVFQNNVILTKTESLTMNSRPKDPKTARNKNVLVIGGSGSGKTRFWLKPNLMQMHSSYVVTDPKKGFLMAGVLFLITCMLMNTMSSCSMMAQSIGSVLSGTTYPSDDPEMLAVEADYAAREVQLQEEIDNIESSHPGYDEYRYDLGMIGHRGRRRKRAPRAERQGDHFGCPKTAGYPGSL